MNSQSIAMLVDYEYCLGCLDCEIACMNERGVGPEKVGIKVMKLGPLRTEDGSWQYDFVPVPTDWQAACVRHCSYNIISCGGVEDLADAIKTKPKMSMFSLKPR